MFSPKMSQKPSHTRSSLTQAIRQILPRPVCTAALQPPPPRPRPTTALWGGRIVLKRIETSVSRCYCIPFPAISTSGNEPKPLISTKPLVFGPKSACRGDARLLHSAAAVLVEDKKPQETSTCRASSHTRHVSHVLDIYKTAFGPFCAVLMTSLQWLAVMAVYQCGCANTRLPSLQ
jgi:hypothetical protein